MNKGYVRLGGYRDHPNANPQGQIYEHTVVMSELLGRPLMPHEQVHHKNGDRADNSPENLELWSKSQPSGARISDKISWAINFLTEQGYTVSD